MNPTMTHIAAVVSMLHEPADAHSATRRFRNQPVLRWTLNRLRRAKSIDTITILCWDDQLPAVAAATTDQDPDHLAIQSLGQRYPIPSLDAITIARRWADGWRGGLLGTCDFDLGFHAESAQKIAAEHDADSIVLIDPAAALIDPVLIESLLEHAETHPQAELVFTPAAPGLNAVLLRRALIDRLTIAKIHPGRLLTYWPDQHGVDPIGKDGCAPVPTPVARTTHRFKLDSIRQQARIDAATVSLNGQLIVTQAEGLVAKMAGANPESDLLPRDIVLELNTKRFTRPIYWPGDKLDISRPDLSLETAKNLFAEIATLDDTRLTIAGVGDPLLVPHLFAILEAAKSAGITAINLETDLLTSDGSIIDRLATSGIDVISVHFPAAIAKTYTAVMNADGFARAFANVQLLETAIKAKSAAGPLIAPVFTKTAINLGEMDGWYDYWIRRLGNAVIVSPTDFAGQIPDIAVADMAPPRRRPCARINSRLSILSDGRVVSCEQDITGAQTLGRIGEKPLQEIWRTQFAQLRACHRDQEWNNQPLCKTCREWHRS